MKAIIAGSRKFPNLGLNNYNDWRTDKAVPVYNILSDLIKESGIQINLVISGCSWGVDQIGKKWAIDHDIPFHPMPAQWYKHGKAAGPMRNWEMAKIADVLFCVHSDTRGSLDMIDKMKRLSKTVYEKKWGN